MNSITRKDHEGMGGKHEITKNQSLLREPSNQVAKTTRIANDLFSHLKVFFSHFSSISSFISAKHSFKGYQKEALTFEQEIKEKNPDLDAAQIKEKSREKAQKYLKYCSATIACFQQDKDWVEPFGFKFFNPSSIKTKDISETMQAKEDCFFDPYMGIKAVVLQSNEEVIICFGSLNAGNYEFRLDENESETKGKSPDSKKKIQIDKKKASNVRFNQGTVAFANEFGIRSKTYDHADLLYQKIASLPEFKGKKITLAGQCFGASLASYVALKNDVPAVCFNSLPLGVGQQEKIGKERLHKAKNLVTHISAQTDYISDNRFLSFFDRALSSIRVRTPGNFGKRYYIPSAYDKAASTHNYIQGSLMKFLGHDKRTKPNQIENLNQQTRQ